ncbi:MAG: acyltransferase [Alphaproteobacteria bacterium]
MDHSGGRDDRIQYLDGLRGVAISLIIGYHAFARWPDIMPYGNAFGDFPVFAFGNLGVQLFFIISGFVIFRSLEGCDSLGTFVLRRWLRLFPAMLICSLLVFATAPLFPERPAGPVDGGQLLPGITLLGPYWLSHLGVHTNSLEGSFWSLYVEVHFYLIASVSYFLFGVRGPIIAVSLAYALGVFVQYVPAIDTLPIAGHAIRTLVSEMGLHHFAWFLSGMFFHLFSSRGRDVRFLAAGSAVAVLSVVLAPDLPLGARIFALVLILLFVGGMTMRPVAAILSNRILLLLGAVSYPLYLLHENALIAMTIKIGRLAPGMPHLLMPVVPVAVLIGTSWVIAVYGEPFVKSLIKRSMRLRQPRSI